MKLASVTSVVIVSLLSGVAAAQPETVAEPKSEQAAFGWSLLGTLAPIAITIAGGAFDEPGVMALGTAGMVLGPTAGHWYAGRWVTGGLIARGGGAALMMAGAVQALGNIDCETGCSGGAAAGPLMLGGAALFVGGTLHDLATAGRSARAYNERQYNVGPTVVGTTTTTTLGLGVSGAF